MSTGFLKFQNCLSILGARTKTIGDARTSPHPVCGARPTFFTILEPQNPWIGEFCVVQERCATNFKAQKLATDISFAVSQGFFLLVDKTALRWKRNTFVNKKPQIRT